VSAQAGVEIAVSVLRALFEAAPAAYEALKGETIETILAKGRAHLPAAGAARAAVDSIFGASGVGATVSVGAPPPAGVLYRVAPTTVPTIERFLVGHVARDVLTPEEVGEIRVLLEVTRALERGELVPVVPPVLDPPVGAWSEPGGSED
jgi:hypothetical protein